MVSPMKYKDVRNRISVSSADFSGNERKYVLDCLDRGWITQGYYVQKLEEAFANLCGTKYAIACSSGTSALHLIMLALGVNENDNVIVPALTYVATANAARYCGANVYFSDINSSNWCIDPNSSNSIREMLDGDPAVIIPVDLYDALSINMKTWDKTTVIKDASHSPGSFELRYPVLAAAFSLYASKVVASGEGGVVATNDEELANTIRLYRGQGATGSGRYYHSVVGYNYRMTDLQAAVGLAQVERLPESLARRRALADSYRSNLENVTQITLQGGERASAWTMAVLVEEDVNRDYVMNQLDGDGIETRPFFVPLNKLPMYSGVVKWGLNSCPVASSIAKRGILLPLHTRLSFDDVDYVCERLIEIVQ